MFQIAKDIRLLFQLGRVRRREDRRDVPGALRAIRAISYEGSWAGFVATYTARLLALTRDGRALRHVQAVRRFIRTHEDELEYSNYCLAYCDYLECVLRGQPYESAGATVRSQPSSPFVRNTLLVT